MSNSGESPAPAMRSARIEQPLEVICLRCLTHLDEPGYEECNANFKGSQRRKCARCSARRHDCEELKDPQVISMLNIALRARDAHAELPGNAPQAQVDRALQDFTDAMDTLKTGLRQYHVNKNKMTGGEHTPRKSRAGATGAGSDVLAASSNIQLQAINKSLQALVEVGRVLVRSAGGSAENIDRIMRGDQPLESEEEEEEVESEDDEEEPAGKRKRGPGGRFVRRGR